MLMRMNAVTHIRKNILGATQGEIAAIVGVGQTTVSRWERGELSPDLDQMRRLRSELLRRGVEWDDAWFFDVPEAAE
jgi:Predicted transcriptional regulator with C-terminal CBS domains